MQEASIVSQCYTNFSKCIYPDLSGNASKATTGAIGWECNLADLWLLRYTLTEHTIKNDNNTNMCGCLTVFDSNGI